MKNARPYRKFRFQQKKVEDLGNNDIRFKRIYSEYETMSEELWAYQNIDNSEITDDFLEAFRLQTNYLEEQIEIYLKNKL